MLSSQGCRGLQAQCFGLVLVLMQGWRRSHEVLYSVLLLWMAADCASHLSHMYSLLCLLIVLLGRSFVRYKFVTYFLNYFFNICY